MNNIWYKSVWDGLYKALPRELIKAQTIKSLRGVQLDIYVYIIYTFVVKIASLKVSKYAVPWTV